MLGARGLLLPLPLLRLMLLLLGGQPLKTVHPPLAPGLLLLLVSCLLHPTPFPCPNHGGGRGSVELMQQERVGVLSQRRRARN